MNSTVSFSALLEILPPILEAKFPVLLRGPHGIGKSQVVYQIANKLGLPVIERRASQMTEGDLIGLPDARPEKIGNKKATTFNPPDWYLVACEKPVALFLDELDRATPEVRQGFFQLADSRMLNGHRLHEGTLIFGAINGGASCAANYQVGEMDPAELDRWTVFDVEPTIEDWLSWGKEHVVDVIWDFINQNRSHLEHSGVFEPNKVYPSRRSWDRLSQAVNKAGFAKDPKASASGMFHLANAFVGFEGACAFRDFCQNFERQVTLEMILDEGKIEATKAFAIAEHSAMVEKMEHAGVFNGKLTDKQIKNLVAYAATLPSEVLMKMITIALPAGAEGTDIKAVEKQFSQFYQHVKAPNGKTLREITETVSWTAAESK
jgi:hypothetical protein